MAFSNIIYVHFFLSTKELLEISLFTIPIFFSNSFYFLIGHTF